MQPFFKQEHSPRAAFGRNQEGLNHGEHGGHGGGRDSLSRTSDDANFVGDPSLFPPPSCFLSPWSPCPPWFTSSLLGPGEHAAAQICAGEQDLNGQWYRGTPSAPRLEPMHLTLSGHQRSDNHTGRPQKAVRPKQTVGVARPLRWYPKCDKRSLRHTHSRSYNREQWHFAVPRLHFPCENRYNAA